MFSGTETGDDMARSDECSSTHRHDTRDAEREPNRMKNGKCPDGQRSGLLRNYGSLHEELAPQYIDESSVT